MAAADYRFITHWRLNASVKEVTDILGDAERLPEWWPSVYLDVRVLSPGEASGVGKQVALYTKGWLPYTLHWQFRVTAVSATGFALAAEGDFEGRGVWAFEPDGDWVNITYDWNIRANKPLLRSLSSLLKPIFAMNHHWAMRQGETSLKLEVERRRLPEAQRKAIPAPPPATPSDPLQWLVDVLQSSGKGSGSAPNAAFHFDPDQVAHYEVEGWRAYYDRDWLRLLRLIVALAQAQFRITFPDSLRAAYHITRASVAWVPKTHDAALIERHLQHFYAMARRSAKLRFAVDEVAALERRYWDVHRRLVGNPDKSEFVQTMTALHAAVFGLSEDEARESAGLRVEANNVLDTITGQTSPDPARDWQRCEELLTQCYRSVREKMA
jgi:hypothetical protein